MALAAISENSWRLVFGNTEDWNSPRLERPEMMDESAPTAANWRIIFGSTAAWLPPRLEKPLENSAPAERCELCRQPITLEEDFLANSAGQRLSHVRCLDSHSRLSAKPKPWSTWLETLCNFLRS